MMFPWIWMSYTCMSDMCVGIGSSLIVVLDVDTVDKSFDGQGEDDYWYVATKVRHL